VSEARVGRALAVGAGQAPSSASHFGGEPVGRQPWVQFESAQVVPKYVGAPALVGQAHPHDLVEAAWPAQGRVDMLGAVGGGQHKNLTAFLYAVEQDQELGDDRDLMLGALGRARWGDGIDLVEQDDGRGEFLSALEDVSERGLGLADPLRQESRAIDDFDVGAALAGNSPGQKGLPSTWGAGEDDAVAKGLGADAQEDVGVLEGQLDQVACGLDCGVTRRGWTTQYRPGAKLRVMVGAQIHAMKVVSRSRAAWTSHL